MATEVYSTLCQFDETSDDLLSEVPVQTSRDGRSRMWVMTAIYEDDPLEAPGLLVGTSPEAVVNGWLQDELAGIETDASGFPAWTDQATVVSRFRRNVVTPLLAQANGPSWDGIAEVTHDGQRYTLQARVVLTA